LSTHSSDDGLHIGYLIQQYPPEIGAGPARAFEFAQRWIDWGARVTVYTALPNRPEGRIHEGYRGRWRTSENACGIAIRRSWLYASPRHGFARTIANNVSFMVSAPLANLRFRDRPDILIASSPPFFVHTAGLAMARAWRVPLVLEVRDLWPDYLAGMGAVRGPVKRALFAFERFMIRRAQHVVVVTDTFARRVVEKGALPDEVTVVPNAVDGDLYYRDREARLDIVRPAGDGSFIVGYLGNIGASQGKLFAVADAAARLADEPHIRFVVAGGGTEAAAFRARLEEIRPGNVTMLPPLAKTDTNAFYNSCDVCLVPLANVQALQETIPSKLFEAMACQRPVIASVAGEAASIVAGSRCGLVCPPDDAAALADAIRAVAAATEHDRDAMGTRGREYALREFGRGALARRYYETLAGVAAGTSRSCSGTAATS
jgi:colanic acid biosynthesis glycosyl transferase WcaI